MSHGRVGTSSVWHSDELLTLPCDIIEMISRYGGVTKSFECDKTVYAAAFMCMMTSSHGNTIDIICWPRFSWFHGWLMSRVESTEKGPVVRSLGVFFVISPNKQQTVKLPMIWNTVTLDPVGTLRDNNVFTTSKRRRRHRFDVMKTLSLRHYCVMCP